jgi:hypothetical protein
MAVSVDKLTETYLKIKNKRSEISAQFKLEDDALSAKQDKIKAALLSHCKENNVDSVRTQGGTFFRQVRSKYWTSDWESMYKFVLDNKVPEFFTKRLNQSNIKQFLEENPESVPPGLNIDSEYVLLVRKSKK